MGHVTISLEKFSKLLKDNKDNTSLLKSIVQECNSYDGSLDEYVVYEFDDDFFDTYFESKEEVARATFFGTIQNWLDEYIRFNGYGNLESLNDYQYAKELEEGADDIIQTAIDMFDNIDAPYLVEDLEV